MANVEMYSSDFCPFCYRAQTLLDSKGVEYTLHNVDFDPQLRQEMEQRSQRHTVPQIFINENHIGGCDDIFALEQTGRLDELLQSSVS